MSNLAKHRILKVLNDHYQNGEKKSNNMNQVTDLGKSLTYSQIHEATNFRLLKIHNLAHSMIQDGLVQSIIYDNNGPVYYLITDLGMQALFDKKYLNSVWFRKWSF